MYKTIGDVRKAMLSGTTVLEITNYYLNQIEICKSLNAFVEVFEDEAISQSKIVDEKIRNGSAGKLAGVIVAIKDNICYKDHKVSASSKILENFTSLFTSTALQKLIDEDAIVIGRLNCDEFAMGGSNETSYFGSVKNNINERFVPGGSSGGSAVAVSANMCTVSLGSDTGGSIRQPASWTNTFGIKPTYGSVSRFGLIAYASSFDQIGCFANSIDDLIEITKTMSGFDAMDSTSSKEQLSFSKKDLEIENIAVFKEHFENDLLNDEIKNRFLHKLEEISKKGVRINEYSFPYFDALVPCYYILTTAEASSNLSRYDGVHYGYRSKHAKGLDQTYKLSRTEGFGDEVKRRILAGTFVLSHGYYDAYYSKAQKVRQLIKSFTNDVLQKNDLIMLPTTVGTAFELNAITDPITMYLQDIYTVHANLTGNPAISIPFGFNSNKMPFGLQFMGREFEENEMISNIKYLMN